MSRCPLLTSAGAGSVESTYTDLRRASSGSSFWFTAPSAGNTTISRWVWFPDGALHLWTAAEDRDLGCWPQRIRFTIRITHLLPKREAAGVAEAAPWPRAGAPLSASPWRSRGEPDSPGWSSWTSVRRARPCCTKCFETAWTIKFFFNRSTATERVQKALNARLE